MIDINSYTGKRYGFMSYNCWQHVVAVRHAVGIKTKMYVAKTDTVGEISLTFDIILHENKNNFISMTELKNYDIVIFKRPVAGINYYHAGVWFNGWVSHSCSVARQVVFEPLREAVKNRRSKIKMEFLR